MRHWVRTGAVLFAAVCMFFASGCRRSEGTSANRDATFLRRDSSEFFRERISATAVNNHFDSCLHYARSLLRQARTNASATDEAFACCYIGQSSFFLSHYDTASLYLEQALHLSRSQNDVWGMGAACNGLGQLAVCSRMDYLQALGYFTESVRVLEGSPYHSLYYVATNNLALTYWHRNNPAGLPYALKVLEYGRQQQDTMLLFYGSYTCAAMYYLLGKYETALDHIGQTVELVDRYYDHTGVYTLSADIALAAGCDSTADAHYRMAGSRLGQAEATSAIGYYLSYSRYLIDRGRYREAQEILGLGIEAAERSGNLVSRHRLYRNLSQVYRRTGRYAEALDMFERFHSASDSIFTVERERLLSEMQVKYETEKKENELRTKQYEVLKERRKVQVTALLAAAIAAVLLVVWILYRRKNALYLRIVSQYQEAVRREKALAEADTEAPGARHVPKYAPSSLSDEKSRLLFTQLERLMRREKIYRQQDLTKERLAELAACNRTYLSQVVNERTGMNLVSYINSFRINEAIELLSDADNEIPLKAVALEVGFSSLSTFYKFFNRTVGMTPMKFREKVAELARSRCR